MRSSDWFNFPSYFQEVTVPQPRALHLFVASATIVSCPRVMIEVFGMIEAGVAFCILLYLYLSLAKAPFSNFSHLGLALVSFSGSALIQFDF